MSPRTILRTTVGVLLALAAVAGCVDEADGPAPGVADPAFYLPPDPLPPGKPGDVLRVEEVPGLGGEGKLLRVLYRSESLSGQPIAVSGLIAVPPGAPPAGGWPVLSLAHGTVGLADACAPSLNPVPQAAELAAQGYVLVATDYEGLGTPGRHPYLVGESEARGVIDGVRAARALGDQVGAGSRYAVIGYSQGGHAALFANEIATTWAPELSLVGVVAGAPAVELDSLLDQLDQPTSDWLNVMITAGFEAAYPQATPAAVLTQAGLERLPLVDAQCSVALLSVFSAGDSVQAALRHTAPFDTLLVANTPGQRRGAAPILVLSGTEDELIKAPLLEQAITRLCATGQSVERRSYPGINHAGLIGTSLADAVEWSAGAFRSPPTGGACS